MERRFGPLLETEEGLELHRQTKWKINKQDFKNLVAPGEINYIRNQKHHSILPGLQHKQHLRIPISENTEYSLN